MGNILPVPLDTIKKLTEDEMANVYESISSSNMDAITAFLRTNTEFVAMVQDAQRFNDLKNLYLSGQFDDVLSIMLGWELDTAPDGKTITPYANSRGETVMRRFFRYERMKYLWPTLRFPEIQEPLETILLVLRENGEPEEEKIH